MQQKYLGWCHKKMSSFASAKLQSVHEMARLKGDVPVCIDIRSCLKDQKTFTEKNDENDVAI